MHLTPEELLDLAEGTRAPSSVPHLATCSTCREQLDELRDVMASLLVDVPEPSPLFWDHLCTRVREAIAADDALKRGWFGVPRMSWSFVGAMSVAAAAVAVALSVRAPAPVTHRTPVAETTVTDVGSAPSGDDPSFTLLGDLAGNFDWDAVAAAGITMDVGTADDAVRELSDSERAELQRLLNEAIATS